MRGGELMATSHFQRELLPTARAFYERQGLRLARPNSKHWAMAQGQPACHKSKSGKSFSVNLDSGGFFCHGCKASGGDIIAYVALRDHLSQKQAAIKLGCYNESPSPEDVRRWAEQARERDRERQAEEFRQSEQRRWRLKLRDEVHTAARIQIEASARLTGLSRGASPCTADEEEACWAVMQLALDDLRESERAYCAVGGLECEW